MKRIGVLSDTHGFIPKQVYEFFKDCDELWHAGDIGPGVLEELRAWKTVRAVWGNCDSFALHYELEERAFFEVEGQRVLMTHIGGSPGHYDIRARALIDNFKPDVFICGHSHILKVMSDKQLNLLYINPGAAGIQGWHVVRTALRFKIEDGQVRDMEVFELPRANNKFFK